MPSINDLMVIIIIPILDYIIYPHLKKSLKLEVKPLHKVIIDFMLLIILLLLIIRW